MADLETTAGLESPEDDWARGVFDRVRTGQHEPHWIPDAEAAARLSSRHRTRFRAAGALAAVAVVGLSATAFTTLGGSLGKSGAPTGVGPAAAQSTWTGLDLSKYLEIDGLWKEGTRGSAGTLSPTGLSSISTVLQRLDPGLKHIRTTSGQRPLDITPNPPGTFDLELAASGYWAPGGDVSFFPPAGTAYRPTTPFGHVTITATSPRFLPPEQVHRQDTPCGLDSVASTFQVPRATEWSSCVRAHQSDGSDIVVAHSTNLRAGVVTFAARLFPDGSSVSITASTVIGYTPAPVTDPPDPARFVAGPPLDPVPWTDDSLARALAGPTVKGMP